MRVAKVSVVERFGEFAVREPTVKPYPFGNLGACHVTSLVAEAAFIVFTAARSPNLPRITKLDFAPSPFFLAVGDDPDVGANAGVVKHLLRQGDNCFEPVVFDDPPANVALARARAAREKGRATKDNCKPRSVLMFRRAHRLKLADHLLQKEQ